MVSNSSLIRLWKSYPPSIANRYRTVTVTCAVCWIAPEFAVTATMWFCGCMPRYCSATVMPGVAFAGFTPTIKNFVGEIIYITWFPDPVVTLAFAATV